MSSSVIHNNLDRQQRIMLDDDRKFALMKFRRNVHDIMKPHHNDAFLLRWLRARNWNVEAAEKMYRESMRWRQQWGVDDDLKNWEPCEVLTKYIAFGLAGEDCDGSPIGIIPIKGIDIIGLLLSVSRHDFIRYAIKMLEEVLDLAASKGQTEAIVIFDLEGFQIRPYAWRPATQLVISLIQMYEANYPEILKVGFVINAPRVFAIAFNVIKPFLDEYTISKIHVFKSDPKKWKRALKEYIPEDQLPKHYGGTLVDPDGNPRCPSKINQGGVVPKSYYKKSFSEDKDREYVRTTIKSGGKITLNLSTNNEGCYLTWDFSTIDHDIKFGVIGTDSEGKTYDIFKPSRVPSHQMEETGAVQCKPKVKYTVTFDNSYSMFKSKKINYSVYISEPIVKTDINQLPAEE